MLFLWEQQFVSLLENLIIMAIYQELIQVDGRPTLTGVAFGVQGQVNLLAPTYMALLDTGTYHTVVGQGIINDLGLKSPDETIKNFGGVHGSGEMNVYKNITVKFPKGESFTIDIHCAGVYYRDTTPFNLAIGMDILKQGTFVINGFTNRFSLDFNDVK